MRLLRLCAIAWVVCVCAYAGVSPLKVLDTHTEITSMQQRGENLYVSTSQGEVQVYTLTGGLRLSKSVEIPSYKDLFGSSFRPKVFNTDVNTRGEILIVAAGANGNRNLYVCKNENLEILLEDMSIAKAVWISQTQVLVALMSHEILLFDTQQKRILYQTQITQASFSDMVYNSRDSIVYTTGESGVVYAIDSSNGAILGHYDTINKDKVFTISFGGDTLVGAGQDKRLSIYTLQNGSKLVDSAMVKSEFLIYAAGIDELGRYIGYMSDENGSVRILRAKDKKPITTLEGISGVVNSIIFYKTSVFVSCDDSKIYVFNLQGVL